MFQRVSASQIQNSQLSIEGGTSYHPIDSKGDDSSKGSNGQTSIKRLPSHGSAFKPKNLFSFSTWKLKNGSVAPEPPGGEPVYIKLTNKPARNVEEEKNKPAPLKAHLSSCYKSMVKAWEWLVSSRLDLSPEHEKEFLSGRAQGVNGLSNRHGTCYLNTALQLVAHAVRINLEHGDVGQGSATNLMMEVISEKMPTLMALVNKTLVTETDQQRLYQEASRLVGESSMYQLCLGVTESQIETGYRSGGDPKSYLHTLLHALRIPPVHLLSNPGSLQAEQNEKITVLPSLSRKGFDPSSFALLEPFPTCFNVQVEGRKLPDILQPIMVTGYKKVEGTAAHEPAAQARSCPIQYEPTMISVAPVTSQFNFSMGHIFVFVKDKKSGLWCEVNDNYISHIPKEWEADLEEYCSKYACTVCYESHHEAVQQEDADKKFVGSCLEQTMARLQAMLNTKSGEAAKLDLLKNHYNYDHSFFYSRRIDEFKNIPKEKKSVPDPSYSAADKKIDKRYSLREEEKQSEGVEDPGSIEEED